MRIVLNESTNTVHKPSHDPDAQPADCGALRHVSNDRIRVTTEADAEAAVDPAHVDRCGRCFENAGGY